MAGISFFSLPLVASAFRALKHSTTGAGPRIGRSLSVISLTLLGARIFTGYQATHNESPSGFESAEIVSASDVPYPVESIAVGTVVLEATIGETGTVEEVWPIREIPSLTEVALQAVKSWHFKPASLDGKSVRSRTAVAVTFNPAAAPAANVPLPAISGPPRSSPAASLEPEPVEVMAAMFPQYPANSVTTGTVVLRVNIDKRGIVEGATAIRRIPSLTAVCLRVVKEWKFKPAKFQGTPWPSSVALAFVLRPPVGSR